MSLITEKFLACDGAQHSGPFGKPSYIQAAQMYRHFYYKKQLAVNHYG